MCTTKTNKIQHRSCNVVLEILNQTADAHATTSRKGSVKMNDYRPTPAVINDASTGSMLHSSMRTNHATLHATPLLENSQHAGSVSGSVQRHDFRSTSALNNDVSIASVLDSSVTTNHVALHASPFLDNSQNASMSTVTEPTANLLSGSLAGILQNLENQMSQAIHTLSHVNAKLDAFAEKDDQRNVNIENQLNQVMIMLSQANAKLDVIASHERGRRNSEDAEIEVNKFALNPARNVAELEALEQRCTDERFVENVIKSLAKIHGKHRFTGNGQTVCLQLIDYFVDRRFLRDVSWTGVSKSKDVNGHPQMKVAFSKYDGFINLFFQVVLHADEMFTLEACHKFLKQCIRNSKQRLEEIKRLRMPVGRKRRAKNANDLLEDGQEYGEGSQCDGNHVQEEQRRSQEMEEEFLEDDSTFKEEGDGEYPLI